MEQFEEFDDHEMFLKYGLDFEMIDQVDEALIDAAEFVEWLKEESAGWVTQTKNDENADRRESLEKLHRQTVKYMEEFGPAIEKKKEALEMLERNRSIDRKEPPPSAELNYEVIQKPRIVLRRAPHT